MHNKSSLLRQFGHLLVSKQLKGMEANNNWALFA